jgi:hypothetical protein
MHRPAPTYFFTSFLTMASGKEVEEFFSSWLNVSAPMYTKQSRGNELWQSTTQKIFIPNFPGFVGMN